MYLPIALDQPRAQVTSIAKETLLHLGDIANFNLYATEPVGKLKTNDKALGP